MTHMYPAPVVADEHHEKKEGPSDKGTPTVRSVRKAEGLEGETAWPPNEGETENSCGNPTCRKEDTPIMKRNFFRMFAVVGILGLYAACSDNSTVAPKPGLSPTTPSFDATVPFNGSGACMGDDAANVNNLVGNPAWVSGVSKPTDVNCTANDISIATTTIKQFSVGSASGPFTTLAAGDTITCTPGQTIFALAAAQLQTTATERYNIGIWIANDPTQGVQGSAVTGTCFHYNLIPNQNGSNEQNSPADQCGDMSSSIGLASVDLGGDPLVINCTPGVATVQVNNCLGWQNSDQTSSRGSCGTTNIDGNTVSTALAFRYGTLPENSSKCNCTPFSLPISVRGKITIVKNTVGGDGAFSFTSDVGSNSDPVVSSPFTITTSGGTGSQLIDKVKTGTYHIAESSLAANFDFTSLSCTPNNAFASATTSGQTATITMGNGGDITCTFTNTKRTFLTLVKTVTNDNGGTKTTSDFPLTASGPVTISGVSGTTDVTNRSVSAGSYALTEQTQAGYTASSWSCAGGTQSGANITLATGNSATCTINNNDIGATLTLVKVVTNDNGGTKTTSDFPLTASGPVTISGVSGSSAVTGRSVNAGTYALTEQTQTGYTASSWSCSGGTQSGANITLGLGGSATCTISNNDVGPTLTLIKTVTNDNGGTKTVSDFALTASGPIPPSCSAGSTSGVTGNANVTNKVLCAGTYALTEQTQAGYAASSWSCTGGTQSGANITLALAGSATCTINNNDIAPTLTLVKVVTNDNGGTKTTSDFPLTASGPVTISGVSGGTAVTARPVNAGTYALTEQTQTGYTASSWSCAGGSQTGASVALALGGSATCTIINNDNPSFIIVDKISQGGVGTFTFATTGFSMPNNNTLTTVTSGVAVSTGQISVSAGVALSVGEPSPLTGFQLMASSCVVNQGAATITATVVNGVNVTDGVTITQPGTIVECTFDNAVVSGVTRTQGFWATHTALSNLIWDTLVPTVDKQLCTATILTNASPITELSPPGTNQLMGGFWANIAKTSTKTSRTDLDQARMQALQQYLAAAINVAEFHSNTEAFLAAARVIYCGTDVDAIKGLIGTLGSYNSSGDAGAFDPGVSATAQESKKEADIPFWDVTIH
jgi:hypothetical protein